jgi:hypothetical protein
MATPNDRRIIWGTHVIPQVSYSTTSTEETREEGSTVGTASYTDYKLDTTVAKRFGGKGSVDIRSDQGTDEWVSFLSPIDSLWEAVDNLWEATSAVWDNAFSVTASSSTLRTDSVNVDFLYVKNLGSVECKLALHYDDSASNDNLDILIPPEAAVSMRVNSMSSDNIKVQTASSTTTIEYVIARTP